MHQTNKRLDQDLEIVIRHRVPLVITAVGLRADVIAEIHSYGGVVFHDAIHMKHAMKAIEAGVDGIIPICAGGGGNSGALNPFTFVTQLRATGIPVATGIFQADMKVHLVNDGPVTFIYDAAKSL